jgi:hypothetical protein
MSDVFLYLLGAGASCQALPLASEFSERLRSFANDLDQAGPRDEIYHEPLSVPDDPVWGRPREKLREAIWWLAEEASHHASGKEGGGASLVFCLFSFLHYLAKVST